MEPVRIKVYGLLSITRKTYERIILVTVALVAALGVARFLFPSPEQIGEELGPAIIWFRMWEYLPWILLGASALAGLEAYLVLRRFSQEEARQRASTTVKPT